MTTPRHLAVYVANTGPTKKRWEIEFNGAHESRSCLDFACARCRPAALRSLKIRCRFASRACTGKRLRIRLFAI